MGAVPDWTAPIGQVALVSGLVIAAVGVLAVLPPAFRVRRRALGLRATLAANQPALRSALDAVTSQRAEAAAHLASVRRVLRWLRHPLVIAAIQWYRRQRRAHA
jgi:hypothetical protein